MFVFTGIKHSGKTTFSKIVAAEYCLPFYDSDLLLLEHLDTDIRTFYKTKGKESFMALECEVVKQLLSTKEDCILSLGGGACDNEGLIKLCKDASPIIYLYRKEEDLLPIILKDGVPPFLDKDNVEESFHKLFIERDKKYKELSSLTIDLGPFGPINETAERLIKELRSSYGR